MPIESNIWKFYVIEGLKGFWFILPIIVLYLQHFNINYTGIGILDFIFAAVIIIFEIPTGAIADILGRKPSMFLGFAVSAIAMLWIGFSTTITGFLIGYALWAVGDAFQSGASDALLYDTLRDLRKQKSYLKIKGRLKLVSTATLLIGLFIGPILFVADVRFPYFAYGISLFLASLFFLVMKEPKMRKSGDSIKTYYVQIKKSMRYAMAHKFIKWLVFFSIITAIPMFILNTFLLQPHLVDIGFNVATFSIIFPLIYGLASLISAFAYKIEEKVGEKNSFFLITIAQGIMFLLLWLTRVPVILIVIILLYVNRDFKEMIINNYINHNVKSSQRATILSIQSFIANIGFLVTSITVGVMIDFITVQNMFLALGLFTLVLGIPYFFRMYRSKS
ncbi:MAG: MFS transporter [Candidatus Aenigmarchaeota archaeon]|nr:MFS transporter [Candidatus Aenigmarchaeota archaeon]